MNRTNQYVAIAGLAAIAILLCVPLASAASPPDTILVNMVKDIQMKVNWILGNVTSAIPMLNDVQTKVNWIWGNVTSAIPVLNDIQMNVGWVLGNLTDIDTALTDLNDDIISVNDTVLLVNSTLNLQSDTINNNIASVNNTVKLINATLSSELDEIKSDIQSIQIPSQTTKTVQNGITFTIPEHTPWAIYYILEVDLENGNATGVFDVSVKGSGDFSILDDDLISIDAYIGDPSMSTLSRSVNAVFDGKISQGMSESFAAHSFLIRIYIADDSFARKVYISYSVTTSSDTEVNEIIYPIPPPS